MLFVDVILLMKCRNLKIITCWFLHKVYSSQSTGPSIEWNLIWSSVLKWVLFMLLQLRTLLTNLVFWTNSLVNGFLDGFCQITLSNLTRSIRGQSSFSKIVIRGQTHSKNGEYLPMASCFVYKMYLLRAYISRFCKTVWIHWKKMVSYSLVKPAKKNYHSIP